MKRAISILLGIAMVFALVLLVDFKQEAKAEVNAVTPSTNDINRTKGWAHVDEIEKGIGFVKLQFISNRNFYSCFEYRTDGNISQKTNDTNYNPGITDGLYPYYCQINNSRTINIYANEYVEVRMVFGAETDERFDWTRFDVLPNPDLDNDGVLNEEDLCPDTNVDGWGEVLGTNRLEVRLNNEDMMWYQNIPMRKGKGTIPTPMFDLSYTYGCSGSQILDIMNELGYEMKGHEKFGLSSGVLEDFHMYYMD